MERGQVAEDGEEARVSVGARIVGAQVDRERARAGIDQRVEAIAAIEGFIEAVGLDGIVAGAAEDGVGGPEELELPGLPPARLSLPAPPSSRLGELAPLRPISVSPKAVPIAPSMFDSVSMVPQPSRAVLLA